MHKKMEANSGNSIKNKVDNTIMDCYTAIHKAKALRDVLSAFLYFIHLKIDTRLEPQSRGSAVIVSFFIFF